MYALKSFGPNIIHSSLYIHHNVCTLETGVIFPCSEHANGRTHEVMGQDEPF